MQIAVFVLDMIVLVICSSALVRSGKLSLTHPGTVYLYFHAFAFTLRQFLILSGAPTLFSNIIGWEAVTGQEIIRAALIADGALVAMTVAWLRNAEEENARRDLVPVDKRTIMLSIDRIWSVAILTFIVGILGVLIGSRVPGVSIEQVDLGEWSSSTWIGMLQTWPGVALMILIYWYGFRRPLILLMGLYLIIMVSQGYHRFRVIIPLILMAQIYTERNNLKWLPRKFLLPLIATGLLFFPLKSVGRMIQEGLPLGEIVDSAVGEILYLPQSTNSDLLFMDQFAAGLTLMDRSGRLYYGSTYLPLLTLPIPRPLWPEKPALAFYIGDIETTGRPMKSLGMIVTFLGESYANFGYIGVIVVPFLLAYWLGRMYFAAKRHSFESIPRLFYILTASGLLQVYRDGLTSLVLFTIVSYLPLTVLIGLHILFPPRTLVTNLNLQPRHSKPIGRI